MLTWYQVVTLQKASKILTDGQKAFAREKEFLPGFI